MQRRTFLALSGALLATPAFSQTNGANPTRKFSAKGLADLEAAMNKIVADGEVPGITWLLAKDDEVAFGAAGTFEAGGAGAPMARDTIFRIASSSKPIFATAVMMLIEDGKLTPEQKEGAGLFTPDFFDALGWGYGMAVSTAPSAIAPNVGRYGWDGGYGIT